MVVVCLQMQASHQFQHIQKQQLTQFWGQQMQEMEQVNGMLQTSY